MARTSLQKSILVLFHVLLFVTPLYFRFNTEELFEFNKMILVYVLTTLIGGLFVVRLLFETPKPLRKTPFDIPLLLFFGSQVFSTIFSIHPRTSLLGYYSRFHGGLLSTLSYIILFYAFVNTIKKKDLPPLFITATASLVTVAVWAILEHFGHSFSCVLLTGTFDVSCWVQDVQNRVYATFGQPNWLAAFCITLIPLGWYRVLTQKAHITERWFYSLATAVGVAALIFTKSRSGMLGFVLAAVIFAAAATYISVTTKQKNTVKIQALHLSALVIALMTLLGTPFTPALTTLFSKQNGTSSQATTTQVAPADRLEIGGTESGEIRKIVWEGALNVWKKYPLLGSGVETFAYSYYQGRPQEHNLVSEWDYLYNKAHNEFLNFLATTGIIGLFTYILLLAVFCIKSMQTFLAKKTATSEKLLLAAMVSGIAGLSVSNFFGFSTVMVTVLQYLYFAIASLLIYGDGPETKYTPQKMHKYVALSFVVLVGIVLLARIGNYWVADTRFAAGKALLRAGEYNSGLTAIQDAILRSQSEALFYDEFSANLAVLAVELTNANQATASAQTAEAALAASQITLELNPVHLNFYKTRARTLITLSQLQPSLLLAAQNTLETAIARAPNDPKLFYNLALVELGLENTEHGLALLERTVELKPNYPSARMQLGKEYKALGRTDDAAKQFKYILEFIDPTNQEAITELASPSAQIETKK